MKRIAVILFALFLGSPLFHCTDPEIEEQPTIADRPSQELWDSDIYFTKLGTTSAIVHAGHLAKFDDRSLIILNQRVKADFFQENKHTSTLFADSAVILERDVMQAYGNVRVESDSGVILTTEQLAYTQETEKITSDTFVTLTSEVDTLHGKGFISDPDLSNWTINEPHGITRRELEK